MKMKTSRNAGTRHKKVNDVAKQKNEKKTKRHQRHETTMYSIIISSSSSSEPSHAIVERGRN